VAVQALPPGEHNPFEAAPAATVEAGQAPGFHLTDYLPILRRHWKMIAALGLLFMAAGAVHYSITPKLYRAAATVQIERRSVTSLSGEQNPWLENYWSQEYYPTQYRLLQSRGLAERVVQDLRLYEDPAFNPGGLSAESGTPSFEADAAILGGLAGALLGGLEVSPVGGTQLVEIGYRSSDPELAARVANAWADAYIDWGIESRSESASKASDFLASQIETTKQEIQDGEARLQAFTRQQTDIVALDPGSNVLIARFEALNNDYIGAVTERIQKEARLNEILSSPKESVADTASAGLVGQLRGDFMKLERDYALRLQTYKPEFPAMVDLKGQIERARQNLASMVEETVGKERDAARAEYQTSMRREQSLARELAGVKSETMKLSSAAVDYNNLRVEVETRRAQLNELLRRQAETEVASRLQSARESNVRIVDRALMPGGAYRPNLRNDLTMGLLLGLMVGVALMVGIEYLDRTVKTPEEAERLLGLPILAVIPDISEPGRRYGFSSYGYGYGYGYGQGGRRGGRADKKASRVEPSPIELMPHLRPRLVASEAYRGLRTALLLSSAQELKSIAVTSPQSGEGKTATATNLAVVMAQLGRQVLLVDADLRRPRLHDVFKLSNQLGLVNFLTGGARPEDLFQRTHIPNLYVATSGPIPPNPSELLASDRMAALVRMARETFDFVVVDSPPVLAVTDSILVGSVVDAVVLCLRARQVVREDARACRERLRLAGLRVLGLVLNRHREALGRYGKSYYHYSAYTESGEEKSTGSAA
jgi:capsular exopolysaccharide synthesis family protein